MPDAYFVIEKPTSDPSLGYMPGSVEREELKKELERQSSQVVKILLIINGEEIYTEKTVKVTMPHDHSHVIAERCVAGEKELKLAIETVLAAKEEWENLPQEHRSAIFSKTADRIAGSYHKVLNAFSVFGQPKTVFQAEIDIAGPADFLRLGVWSTQEISRQQPLSINGIWNRQNYRPLEDFVCAISSFNFASISGDLPSASVIVGNVALWKPATTAVLPNYYYMKLLMECGSPKGAIDFIPSTGPDVSKYALSDPRFPGFHFIGSTGVFQGVWKCVGENIANYHCYPGLVGETGSKDFIFAHNTADVNPFCAAVARGAFEYQGQKCLVCSRVLIPKSIWPAAEEKIKKLVVTIKAGDVQEFDTFTDAVIDRASFEACKGFIDRVEASPDYEIIAGGTYDGSKGRFTQSTVILCKSPHYESMVTEILGPIVSIHVYDDDAFDETPHIRDTTPPYALTGAVFAQDRQVIVKMEKTLRNASGNFYINDKCTDAVVGQQPFGGARASGTSNKAGAMLNMFRRLSVHAVKEAFSPPSAVPYPYMSRKQGGLPNIKESRYIQNGCDGSHFQQEQPDITLLSRE